jgi:hypothetical protein
MLTSALPVKLVDLLRLGLIAALALATLGYAAFCAAHVFQLLRYPFALDYGEGPLLAQVRALAEGTPLWRIYADPARPPFLVVNYPPVYLLLAAALSYALGSALLAGRVVSLLATLAALAALAVLLRADGRRQTVDGSTKYSSESQRSAVGRWLPAAALLLLTVPVVREWAALMRVDMLALALSLWGLALMTRFDPSPQAPRAVQPAPLRWITLLAPGALFALALYTKPSMLAGPLAGGLWLLAGWRGLSLAARLQVALAWALLAALPLALLQWASGGWFWIHVAWANANRWDAALARQLWADQLRLRWPLFVAGALGALVCLARPSPFALRPSPFALRPSPFASYLPLVYALGALAAAAGVGKVGAYANYFLELYVALVWLSGLALGGQKQRSAAEGDPTNRRPPLRLSPFAFRLSPFAFRLSPFAFRLSPFAFRLSPVLLALLFASTLRYSPVWSKDQLKLAGLLEPNPPRLAWGRYGLWDEAAREAQVLAAMGRAQALIAAEVRDAGGPIFTDMPGFAANIGALAPLQVFEHRQLMDTGHWDQRPLLVELANGALPLAVLDYLGNWITPEMIAVFTHRYAQDGSLGPFDLYRPIDPGPRRPASLSLGSLRLAAFRLVPPPAPAGAFSPGAMLVPTLEWLRVADYREEGPLDVAFVLRDQAGRTLVESAAPLLYGALPPGDWPANAPVQHMQPFELPEELPPGRYTLLAGLRRGGADIAPPWPLAQIPVDADGGRRLETGHYVPGALLAVWEQLGGVERAGYPLTPAVPFAWGTLQCFERLCLEQRGNAIGQRPLGELLYAAETLRADPPAPLLEAFAAYARRLGRGAVLGEPISGPLERNGYTVQWTPYARLERDPATGAVGLGRLGDDALRLPLGTPYRWPAIGR